MKESLQPGLAARLEYVVPGRAQVPRSAARTGLLAHRDFYESQVSTKDGR